MFRMFSKVIRNWGCCCKILRFCSWYPPQLLCLMLWCSKLSGYYHHSLYISIYISGVVVDKSFVFSQIMFCLCFFFYILLCLFFRYFWRNPLFFQEEEYFVIAGVDMFLWDTKWGFYPLNTCPLSCFVLALERLW